MMSLQPILLMDSSAAFLVPLLFLALYAVLLAHTSSLRFCNRTLLSPCGGPRTSPAQASKYFRRLLTMVLIFAFGRIVVFLLVVLMATSSLPADAGMFMTWTVSGVLSILPLVAAIVSSIHFVQSSCALITGRDHWGGWSGGLRMFAGLLAFVVAGLLFSGQAVSGPNILATASYGIMVTLSAGMVVFVLVQLLRTYTTRPFEKALLNAKDADDVDLNHSRIWFSFLVVFFFLSMSFTYHTVHSAMASSPSPHALPEWTYWALSAVPEFLAAVLLATLDSSVFPASELGYRDIA